MGRGWGGGVGEGLFERLIAYSSMRDRFGGLLFGEHRAQGASAWEVQRFESKFARGPSALALETQHYEVSGLPTNWRSSGLAIFGLHDATLRGMLPTQQAGAREM
jgi:hypothetical protein